MPGRRSRGLWTTCPRCGQLEIFVQDAAADGVLLDEEDDELLSFLPEDPEEPDDPEEADELSEEVLLPDEDDSLFDSVFVSPFGTAPARLSVR